MPYKDKKKERAHAKEYRKKNRYKINEYHRKYYSTPKWKNYNKEYYKKNKEKLIKQIKEYYKTNKDKHLKQKKEYYKKNKEKILQHDKKYYEKEIKGKGICVDCGKAIMKGSLRCKFCMTKNERAYNWKGDNVGYTVLHKWIRKNKPKPNVCEICGIKKPREVANISRQYKRDINDFKWLCNNCHKKFDRGKN